MGAEDRKLVVNLFVFIANCVSSVSIIMVNKQLMGKEGYGFTHATTLSGVHFLVTSLTSLCFSSERPEGAEQPQKLPLIEAAFFVIVANISIVSLNFSLMLNSVGFYQICKLALIPTLCCIDFMFFGKTFSRTVIATIAIVLLGVGDTTVTDVHFNVLGSVIAGVGVLSTAAQQTLIGSLQKKYSMEAHELIKRTAPAQGVSMILLGPFVDKAIGGSYIWEYEFSVPSMVFLMGSCTLAALVNLTQYFCIGRFSAVSFQVLGHTKTVGVLFFGWMLFDHVVSFRNLCGMLLAFVGIVAYGIVTTRQTAPPPPPAKADAATEGA